MYHGQKTDGTNKYTSIDAIEYLNSRKIGLIKKYTG
jgi:hypothetical protein